MAKGYEQKRFRAKTGSGMRSFPYTEREASPKVAKDKNEAVTLFCPFCEIPHPVNVSQESPCGAQLRVTVVQPVFRAKDFPEKDFPEMRCAKCGERGGEVVRFNQGYVHTNDCKPGVKMLAEQPVFSRSAKWAFHLKDGRLKNWIKKQIGIPQAVEEITPTGEKTGVILGYVFYRSV